MTDLVWYAAYGSNLSRERFLVYINGGSVPGANRVYEPSRNTDPPVDDRPHEVSADVCFAGPSTNWRGGGIAFLDLDGRNAVKTRLYLVRWDQLEDLVAQENGKKPGDVAIEDLREDTRLELGLGWYSLVAGLGRVDDRPVITVTSSSLPDPTPPTDAYLRYMITGLREAHGMKDDEIVSYFRSVGAEQEQLMVALRPAR